MANILYLFLNTLVIRIHSVEFEIKSSSCWETFEQVCACACRHIIAKERRLAFQLVGRKKTYKPVHRNSVQKPAAQLRVGQPGLIQLPRHRLLQHRGKREDLAATWLVGNFEPWRIEVEFLRKAAQLQWETIPEMESHPSEINKFGYVMISLHLRIASTF